MAKVPLEKVLELGGGTVISKYKGSYLGALQKLYPGFLLMKARPDIQRSSGMSTGSTTNRNITGQILKTRESSLILLQKYWILNHPKIGERLK